MSDAVNPKAFPLATPELTVSILEIVQQVCGHSSISSVFVASEISCCFGPYARFVTPLAGLQLQAAQERRERGNKNSESRCQ